MSHQASVMRGGHVGKVMQAVSPTNVWLRAPWQALWRRFRSHRSGTSAVEFALTAPIFIALLAGTIETGHVFFVQSELTSTAREAVRRLSMDAMTETEAETFIRGRFPQISPTEMSVQFASVDIGSGRTDLTVQLSVPVTNVALLDLSALLPSDLALQVSATMVKE